MLEIVVTFLLLHTADSMLCSYSNRLRNCKIILGSQSPRRQALLKENLGLTFDILISGFAEDIDKSSCDGPEDYVSKTSYKKAEYITKEIESQGKEADMVICADTIVVCDSEVFEKPSDRESARNMLRRLSGRSHQVMTSVTIAFKPDVFSVVSGRTVNNYDFASFVETTDVRFTLLTDSMIEGYINSGECMDKAGSYGIQGLGSSFVEGISGCYFNVVGFPVYRFAKELLKLLPPSG